MKSRNAILLLLAVLLFVTASAATVYLGYRMVSNSGDRAVAAMTAQELEALAPLAAITPAMTADEVHALLGPPSEDLYFLAKWNGYGGSMLSQVRVYFLDQHPVTVRWMKVGYFVYERRL